MKRRSTHIPSLLDESGDASLVEIILVLLVSSLISIVLASALWAMVRSMMP